MSRDKRILLWLDDELAAAIDEARGIEDRSSWIRRKLRESLARGERPAFAFPVASADAPASRLPRRPEAPAQQAQAERRERW